MLGFSDELRVIGRFVPPFDMPFISHPPSHRKAGVGAGGGGEGVARGATCVIPPPPPPPLSKHGPKGLCRAMRSEQRTVAAPLAPHPQTMRFRRVTPVVVLWPNTRLSKHGDPRVSARLGLFGAIGFAGPVQQRRWSGALCGPREGVRVGGRCVGVAVIRGEAGGLAAACNACSGGTCRTVTRACADAATPRVSALLPPEPERGPC